MNQTERITRFNAAFEEFFGKKPERYFSAPGRTEIGGNHTDHQQGRVLAAAIDLDAVAAVALNGSDTVRIKSEGYPLCEVSLSDLSPRKEEYNTTLSLIRGILARFAEFGCRISGFDAYVVSTVLPGSGLSSSAAYEVLVGTVVNRLFFDHKLTAPEIAMVGQYAENVFFGKPCGLMDQMASSVGSIVTIDFACKEKPAIEPIAFDFASCGHALCIIDSGANHADLTDEYSAITRELKKISQHFGKEVLSQIPEEDFFGEMSALRKEFGDRAVLRAYHFYKENARVPLQVEALKKNDFNRFLSLVKESGYSSFMYLQNVIPSGYKEHQEMALALALCEQNLCGRGACRVHGGGFAGTVQAFVPLDLLEKFRNNVDAVLGEGACHVLSIRPVGGAELVKNDGEYRLV